MLGFVLAAIGGVLAGAIVGVILAASSSLLLGNAASAAALVIAVQVVLALGVAVGMYFTLVSKRLGAALRVLFVAMGVGVLGALTVCTAIVSSSSAH